MRLLFVFLAALLLAVACVWWVSVRREGHPVRADRWLSDLTPQALESEIRGALAVGTPLSVVDEFLKRLGVEHSYDASNNIVYATARHLKGSTIIATQCLALKFHFAGASKLQAIDAKVTYIGP